ncbi:MAG: ATP-binding cassette domain-containing protein [Clostridia bacterium]
MLEIVDITKEYAMKDQSVQALKGVSICFRRSEFVSILGPSGCGKTTLLNIVGGLDRYTSGDLIIDGVSTKEFKDKDWDNYRNHRVGFIFQSYNLIPHQTVLENVELALTLSGVSKKERRARAVEVLEKVGLGDKLKNKPNQLSGGQMQRVAIARALVNDPEIILADEPTGALDSKTSVQIMELLKEVSKDRLVIMVTHNPELAQEYSSRIIKLLDGELIEDSMPYTSKQSNKDISKHKEKQNKNNTFTKTEKKKSMSFFMAMMLSLKNLLTKKARTILVAFAGSIGIIGIALILAISSGFSTYINKMQEDTLSTYPITIEEKSVDFTSLMMSMFLDNSSSDDVDHDNDGVYSKDSISSVLNSVGQNLDSNDLNSFYIYLNENYEDIQDHVSAIQYTYDIGLNFYTDSGDNVQPNSNAITNMINKYSMFYLENESKVAVSFDSATSMWTITKTADTDYTFIDQYSSLAFVKQGLENNNSITIPSDRVTFISLSMLGVDPTSTPSTAAGLMAGFGNMDIFYEMLDNDTLLREQYDLVGTDSRYPTDAGDALLVLDKNHEVDEYMLYALGLMSDSDMDRLLKEMVLGNKLDIKIDYDDILGTEYKVLEESDYYVEIDDEMVDFRTYKESNPTLYNTKYMEALNNCTNKVKIVGIVRLNDKTDTGSLTNGIAYTKALTENMVGCRNNSEAVSSGKLSELALNTPSSINIYVNSFDSKAYIQDFITNYNDSVDENKEITYTDLVGIIMSTVSVIINSITYVLIAFVSVSLIVSSIMIGIITYISVIERTKEIGVLRSVGASKRDVKRVFTAESFIIGLTSGVFGILITLLLLLPINLILQSFTGIGGLAQLPIIGSLVLILISVALTFIAGLLPARIAAKKDPVLALRSE